MIKQTLIYIQLSIFTVITLTGFSCKKEEPYMSNAQIIGFDAKMCVCCGGTEIKIDQVANPNGNDYFLIGELPKNFNLGDNPKFPVVVKVDWKIDTTHCLGNYIIITRIARR